MPALPNWQISKMFGREYEAQTGQTVRFRLSFAGSGTQARAVMDGLPADIVALALPLDVMKISEAGGSINPGAKEGKRVGHSTAQGME